jgi:hypothetical protein
MQAQQHITYGPNVIYGDEPLHCEWHDLRGQLLLQWCRLSPHELDEAGPNRQRLARLIQRRYGISAPLVISYLQHFEHILPTF